MSQTLKVAVIGIGQPGKWHADKYAAAYSDYRDIILLIGVISLVVPRSLHYKIARVILEAGIHCLIEKPTTESIAAVENVDEVILST